MKIKKTISSLAKRCGIHPAFIEGSQENKIPQQVRGEKIINVKDLASYRPNVLTSSKKAAFTLAELLITLGIIGVVAAITIPTLVAYNQQRGWDTADTVFQRKLGEALQVMNVQQTLSGWNSTEEFVNELQNHLKLINRCQYDNLQSCFTDKVLWNNDEVDMTKIKTAQDIGKGWNTKIVGIQTASGINALVAYNPNCKSDPYSNQTITLSGIGSVSLGTNGCLAALYDVQGFSKPNEKNKDIRTIGGAKLPKTTCVDAGGVCVSAVLKPGDYSPVDCSDNSTDENYDWCTAGALHNNPKFTADYWAGAMAECSGKLPSLDDLAKIANYIYNTDIFSASTNNISLGAEAYDGDKASEIGFPPVLSSAMAVWTPEEDRGSRTGRAYWQVFWSYGSLAGPTSRYNDSGWVVCVGG